MNWPMDGSAIRCKERESIAAFVAMYRHFLAGRVLDFGAGKQPYKSLLTHCTDYVPIEKGDLLDLFGRPFEGVLCTQVVQYIEEPRELFELIRSRCYPRAATVITYPTNWPEVEATDLFRYTKNGMEYLLEASGWTIEQSITRYVVDIPEFKIAVGGGIIARA